MVRGASHPFGARAVNRTAFQPWCRRRGFPAAGRDEAGHREPAAVAIGKLGLTLPYEATFIRAWGETAYSSWR